MLTQIRIPALGLGQSRPAKIVQANLVENTAAAVAALFARQSLDGRWLQVEVREQPSMTSPLTGKAVHSAPAGVLWQGSRPLAVLTGGVLALNATAPKCVRDRLVAEARARSLSFQHVREPQLWRLLPEEVAETAAAG